MNNLLVEKQGKNKMNGFVIEMHLKGIVTCSVSKIFVQSPLDVEEHLKDFSQFYVYVNLKFMEEAFKCCRQVEVR